MDIKIICQIYYPTKITLEFIFIISYGATVFAAIKYESILA